VLQLGFSVGVPLQELEAVVTNRLGHLIHPALLLSSEMENLEVLFLELFVAEQAAVEDGQLLQLLQVREGLVDPILETPVVSEFYN